MTKAKKIGIGIGITVGGIILSIFAFMLTENFEEESVIEENTQRTFEEDLTLIVFDLNFCPNQGKIIGEMWFLPDESSTVPVQGILNYEITSPDKLIQIGRIEISKEDFRSWSLSGKEMYEYDLEIPVTSDVIDKDIIFTVTLENGDNLVYEDKIKHIDSLDNCKFS